MVARRTTAWGRQTAASAVSDLLRIARVVPMESADFHHALILGLADYDDAVQSPIALRAAGEVLALLHAAAESSPDR